MDQESEGLESNGASAHTEVPPGWKTVTVERVRR